MLDMDHPQENKNKLPEHKDPDSNQDCSIAAEKTPESPKAVVELNLNEPPSAHPTTTPAIVTTPPVRSWSNNDFSDLRRWPGVNEGLRATPSEHSSTCREPPLNAALAARGEQNTSQASSIKTNQSTECGQGAPRSNQSGEDGGDEGATSFFSHIGALHGKAKDEVPQIPQIPQPSELPSTKLEDALERATEGQHTKTPFIPINAQITLINREAIRDELKLAATRLKDFRYEDLDHWTNEIYHSVPYEGEGKKSCRRALFGILVLVGHPERIFPFIQQSLFDKDLPFDCQQPTPPDSDQVLEGVTKPLLYVDYIAKWPRADKRNFNLFQWQFLAPFFNMNQEKVLFYPLRDSIPLPFVDSDSKRHIVVGGFGQVYKVEIHRDHHNYACPNFPESADRKQYFAVKKLYSPGRTTAEDKKLFDLEVEALKRFSKQNTYDHLIKLLATYYHEGQYHLIFPWANGNLRNFWAEKKTPPRTYDQLLWIAEQCCGLTQGLKMLHTNNFDTSKLGDSLSPPNLDGQTARHGDIKPANILWFETARGPVLKISDFGLTRFHRKVSEHRMYEFIVGSSTYRAPECDLEKGVSPKYDMWALGCVFLEFLSWYMLGFEHGVEAFSGERTAEDNAIEMKQDAFFSLVSEESGAKFGARLKDCVIKHMEILYASDHATLFIYDFLELINKHLLRIRVEERMTSTQALAKLDVWLKKCKGNEKYCIGQPELGQIQFRSTNESDKRTVRMNYSPKQIELNKIRRSSTGLSNSSMTDSIASGVSEGSHTSGSLPAIPGPPISPRRAHAGISRITSILRELSHEDSQDTLENHGGPPTHSSEMPPPAHVNQPESPKSVQPEQRQPGETLPEPVPSPVPERASSVPESDCKPPYPNPGPQQEKPQLAPEESHQAASSHTTGQSERDFPQSDSIGKTSGSGNGSGNGNAPIVEPEKGAQRPSNRAWIHSWVQNLKCW